MKAIQEAVRACLEERSGVPAVSDRSLCRQYPMLAVSVREGGTVLIDGGKQVEHTYLVTVSAAPDRERTGQTELLSRLVPLLLRGVPLRDASGDRVLHPLDIRTEGEELTFSVVLCVRLPETEKQPGVDGLELMEILHVYMQ